MNTKYPLTYLSGGDRYFGPDFGSTTVNTLSRKGYAAQCPNAGRLFRQLVFTVPLENEIMGDIPSGQQASGRAAATRYLKAHPDLLGPWLDGITTIDGKDGLAAVRQKLGVAG
jgi:glycine betaine/proline transport system substrate-binding protein